MVAMFLAAADQTILASALPTIAGALGGFADLSWIVVAYLLAATIAAPLYGHVGDRFGRRRMLLVALGVFCAASIVCAFAPTLPVLIGGRALQGLGGGGLMTLAQAMIGENVPPRERGRFQGYFAAVMGLASTSGPILGAYLTEHASWRAIFAINVPLCLVAALLARRIPVAPVARNAPFRLDFVGALLFCGATAAFLFGLTSAGHRFAWWSWQTLALVSGAGAGYVALVAWERRAADPVIPVRLLARPSILRSDAVVVCFAAALFATILYLPMYLQLARGMGIGASGLLLLPITLSMVSAATVTGRHISRTGHVNIFPVIGLSLAALALATMAVALPWLPTPALLVLTTGTGIGLGMVMPPTQITVQSAAGREALGAATASISLSRSLGGALGVAIVGAIVFALANHGDVSTQLSRVLAGGPAVVALLTPAERLAIGGELTFTYRVVFAVIAGFSAAGALLALTVPKLRL
jgi:EmrB/QacA subfamily drug resistance transporter